MTSENKILIPHADRSSVRVYVRLFREDGPIITIIGPMYTENMLNSYYKFYLIMVIIIWTVTAADITNRWSCSRR